MFDKNVIMAVLMHISTILAIVSNMPQIVKSLKTKSTEDISISSKLSWIVCSSCYFCYAILLGSTSVILNSLVDVFFNTTLLVLSVKYRKGREERLANEFA